MIPRLNPRGSSFRGACSYVLREGEAQKGKETVPWAITANLSTQDIKWAWHEMVDTYNAQGALKAASGVDARGRKNTKPVLHYTLSWAQSDNPTPQEMQKAALASLKAIGLGEHEALIAAHTDKKHLHVHIVANTIHPQTGRTADLKFTKLELSKWAEAYEREHVIHCEERVKNNAERERLAKSKRLGATAMLKAASELEQKAKDAYVPVKHRAASRKQWFDRQEIVDRMKAMRKEIDLGIKAEKDATWQAQSAERDALDAQTTAAIDATLQNVKDHYQPYWRELYRAQRRDRIYLKQVMAYEARLKEGKPPSAKEALTKASKPTNPVQDLERLHEQQRRALSRQQREDAQLHTAPIMEAHREQFDAMRDRQADERKEQAAKLHERTRGVTFMAAKEALQAERDSKPTHEQRQDRKGEQVEAAKSFDQAASGSAAPVSRSQQIKSSMTKWRAKNRDRDSGREM